MTQYFDQVEIELWSLDGLAEWCALNVSCDKKRILDGMKKGIHDVLNKSASEYAKLKANNMLKNLEGIRCSLRMLYPSVAHFGTVSRLGVELLTWKLDKNKSNFFECLENLKKIRNDETLQLAQIKSEETIQLAEIKSKNLQEHTIKVVKFHKNIAEDLTTVDRKRKESPLDEDVEQEYDAKTTSAENFKKRLLDFDYDSDSSIDEAEDSEDETFDLSKFTFDGWVDKCDKKRWTLSSGEKVRDFLLKMTRKEIEKVNQLEKVDGKILSIIRLGLSSIIDLSSEFDKGMCTWFGENWEDLKMKVSKNINFEVKKLEGDTLSDAIKMEKLCATYHYWEARAYLLDKLKERPIDDKHRQVLKIYYHLIDMLLENPCTFVNKEGGKKNLTEIEYIMKVSSPILEIIFSNDHDLVYLKWGETVSKSTLNRKIDLRVLTAKGDIELSHSEFARKATPVKIIKDRRSCRKFHFGIQSAGLEGQLFAIDLLDNGLYFSLDGPTYRFPAQLCDINTLRNSLKVLYFFKENAISKVKYLSCDNGNGIAKILHSRAITTKPKHHKISYIKKTYFTPKESISSEIKALYSRE
ncbi:14510_t:CDS:10 [Funneliformis caledonium]|uniref:14510_t:CDS:1 n=1 Tax=Funneliformis caledonium TaxID=1117310 RepID=A0A9N9FI94_9GLOM|nr:14510_t:CDS:10 [Funneliformis caledonium]